jgi:hypothetical protein
MSWMMSDLDHKEGRMGHEEEVFNFTDDPLEGQAIWSILVVGPLDALQDSNKLHHLGSKPLEEATVEILGELAKELGVQVPKPRDRQRKG